MYSKDMTTTIETVTLKNGETATTGCWISDRMGFSSQVQELIDLANNLVGFNCSQKAQDIEDGIWLSDEALDALNDQTPAPYIWDWSDGEVFFMDVDWWD